jgi:hypothetical protein
MEGIAYGMTLGPFRRSVMPNTGNELGLRKWPVIWYSDYMHTH